MQDEVKVSQAARDAAAQLMPVNTLAECEYVAAVKAGKHDGDYRVQAFAKFEQSNRHQAERDTLARIEPVAWLYTSENGKKRVTSFEQWAPHIVAEIGATEVSLYALPPAPEAGQ